MSILETVLSHESVVPMKKLTDYTVAEDTDKIEIDLTGNTWNEHMLVLLRYTPAAGNSVESRSIWLNGSENSGGHFWIRPDVSTYKEAKGVMSVYCNSSCLILLYTDPIDGYGVSGFGLNWRGLFSCHASYSTDQITRLTVGAETSGTPVFKAGTRLEIIGVL